MRRRPACARSTTRPAPRCEPDKCEPDMIQTIEADGDGLSVQWESGGRSRFPYLWLRDNCACAACRDSRNGQRLFDALDLLPEPRPAEMLLAEGAVAIRWAA